MKNWLVTSPRPIYCMKESIQCQVHVKTMDLDLMKQCKKHRSNHAKTELFNPSLELEILILHAVVRFWVINIYTQVNQTIWPTSWWYMACFGPKTHKESKMWGRESIIQGQFLWLWCYPCHVWCSELLFLGCSQIFVRNSSNIVRDAVVALIKQKPSNTR